MPFEIRDGEGQGYKVGVNPDNRLQSAAYNRPASAAYTLRGRLFIVTTFAMAEPGDGVVRPVLWVKNTGADVQFVYERITVAWNGGLHANGSNAVLRVDSFSGASEPTANFAQSQAFSLNASVGYNPSFDARYWDGVGSGMTQASPGVRVTSAFYKAGNGETPSSGEIILGPGSSSTLGMSAPEAGVVQITLTGYFRDLDERF